jgi:hypothetical protein
VKDRLVNVMTAPLESVVDIDVQKLAPRELVEEWDLPTADRVALARWGLPELPLMYPRFQRESAPVLVPNVAGERERSLISSEQRLYKLIDWGRDELQLRIGAVNGTGAVLAVRPRPITVADIPLALREPYKDLYKPAVVFIDSSVSQFVEVLWRWNGARRIFLDLWEEEPHYTRPEAERIGFYERVGECRGIVLDHIKRIDDKVRTDDPECLWTSIVMED